MAEWPSRLCFSSFFSYWSFWFQWVHLQRFHFPFHWCTGDGYIPCWLAPHYSEAWYSLILIGVTTAVCDYSCEILTVIVVYHYACTSLPDFSLNLTFGRFTSSENRESINRFGNFYLEKQHVVSFWVISESSCNNRSILLPEDFRFSHLHFIVT